jgi:hypothetical protein
MKCARIIAWTAPTVLVLTLGAVGAGLTSGLEWKRGPGRVLGSLSAYVAHWASGMTPAGTAETTTPPSTEAADTSLVIGMPPESTAETATPTAAEVAAPMEPDPVDYARLNQDVLLVADALEQFNQKLLRMIAQARAAQLRTEAQAASESKPESGLDAGAAEPVWSAN